MKAKVIVTITKEIEVEIPDSELTPCKLEEFSKYMFKVDVPEDLMKYAAEQIAQNEGIFFIEGLGEACISYARPAIKEQSKVVYNTLSVDLDSEVRIQE